MGLGWKWTPTSPIILLVGAAMICWGRSSMYSTLVPSMKEEGVPHEEVLAMSNASTNYALAAMFFAGTAIGGAVFLEYGRSLGRRSTPPGPTQD